MKITYAVEFDDGFKFNGNFDAPAQSASDALEKVGEIVALIVDAVKDIASGNLAGAAGDGMKLKDKIDELAKDTTKPPSGEKQ